MQESISTVTAILRSAAGGRLRNARNRRKTDRPIASAACLLFLAGCTGNTELTSVDPAEDHKHFGSPQNSLFWTPREKVASFRNIDKIFPTRVIAAGEEPLELPVAPVDLGPVSLGRLGFGISVDEYLAQQRVAGLLVIKDGAIVYERYGLGNDRHSKWISYSVAKSVVSMLIGAAIRDGYIASVDDPVTRYVPRLQGSSYDQSSIRNVLQMASGVAWNEDYADPKSDVNSAAWETLQLYEYLRDKPRAAEPGQVFNYNTAETNLAGAVLGSAIGRNLATYLSEKIWQPYGMEADGYWMLTATDGDEFGGCCISATLRDYGRLGMFALAQGHLADGTPVLANDWMEESTTPSRGYNGYGYFWWLTGDGVFRASGIFGQGIYINRHKNIVIALHSARDAASQDSDWALQAELFDAIVKAL